MDRRAKYILAFILILILTVVVYRYIDYFLNQNFLVEANTVCNTETESCFKADCSVDIDPECDTTPYKKVEIIARVAPKCLEEHSCEKFSCDGLGNDCSTTYCSEDVLDKGEVCAIPEVNNKANGSE